MDWTDLTPVVSLLAGAAPAVQPSQGSFPAATGSLPARLPHFSHREGYMIHLDRQNPTQLSQEYIGLLRSAFNIVLYTHLRYSIPFLSPQETEQALIGLGDVFWAQKGLYRQPQHCKRDEGHEQPGGSSSSKTKAGVTAGEEVSRAHESSSLGHPCALSFKNTLGKHLVEENRGFGCWGHLDFTFLCAQNDEYLPSTAHTQLCWLPPKSF